MRPALQLKFSNQLSLTPQLKQAIKLLTMSNLELDVEISSMLESNAVLELDDDIGSAPSADDCVAEADRRALDLAVELSTQERGTKEFEQDSGSASAEEFSADGLELPSEAALSTSDDRC